MVVECFSNMHEDPVSISVLGGEEGKRKRERGDQMGPLGGE